MPQPTPYTRQADFSDFSAGNPSRPHPGTNLDAEFDGIKETLDDTLANLALIQRDDGALKNEVVTLDSIAPGTADALTGLSSSNAASAAASASSASASASAASASASNASASAITASEQAAIAVAKMGQFIDPRDAPFNAVGDGVTDDAAALAAALATGKMVWLQPGVAYAFGARLLPPSGGGFVGGGTLVMLTGAGKFDAADYLQSYDRTIGVFMEGVSKVRIEARFEMQANASIRTCSPLWVRSCDGVELNVEISGFKEMRFGAIEWNSNSNGRVDAYIHDCASDSNTLPSMQITGLSVDNNRDASITSVGLVGRVQVEDLEMGTAAIAAYGYQTDAVSLMGSGYAGHNLQVVARNVHEALDVWSDHNVIDVVAKDVLFGAKVIYGASNNVIRGTVFRYMKNAVYIGGGSATLTSGNRLYFTSTGGGEIGTFSGVSAVAIEADATSGPARNYVEMTAYGNGVDLDNGAVITGTGAVDNEILLQGQGWVAVGSTVGNVVTTNNRIRRNKGTLVRASLSTNTAYADLAVIICDTEGWDRAGEYDPTTGIFTCSAPGAYRIGIKGSLSVNAGDAYGTYIDKNLAEHSRKRETNTGAGGANVAHDHSTLVLLAPGDTIRFRHDGAGTNTWFAGGSSTYIEIEEA